MNGVDSGRFCAVSSRTDGLTFRETFPSITVRPDFGLGKLLNLSVPWPLPVKGGGWQSPHSRGRGSVKRVNGRKALWTASGKQEARTRVRVIVIATMVFTHSKMKMSHTGLASAAIGTSDLTSLSTLWSDHRYHTIFFVPDLFCAADYKHVTYGTTQCLE